MTRERGRWQGEAPMARTGTGITLTIRLSRGLSQSTSSTGIWERPMPKRPSRRTLDAELTQPGDLSYGSGRCGTRELKIKRH